MNEIFRKKSIDRVNSPEQLNDYIRVATPSVWMVLAAIVVLLIGVCVWGVFGHLDTQLDTFGVCRDGKLICYLTEADISQMTENALVSVDGNEYPVAEVSAFSIAFSEAEHAQLLPEGTFPADTRIYVITAHAPQLQDGTYSLSLIVRRETPMSFVVD